MEDNLPWSLKYQPKSIGDVLVSPDIVGKVMDYIDGYKTSKKKSLILFGRSGTGKTTLAHTIANEKNLEIIEVNASDTRNKDSIKSLIGNASKQMSLFGSGKIILIDEIDGISGRHDRGGILELIAAIKESSFPIIITAENPWDSKFSKLRSISHIVEMKEVSSQKIAELLNKIIENESIISSKESLDFLSRCAKGDIRSAINDLQSSVETNNEIVRENLSAENLRDITSTIPDALKTIFKSDDFKLLKEVFSNFDGDFNDVFLWIDYNLPLEYENTNSLAEAYENISIADVYNGRIRTWQYWRYLVYVNLFLSCGVGLSKEEANKKFIKYQQSSRILKIWMANRKNAKRDSIAEKISKKIHWSKKKTIKNFKFYQIMAQNKNFLKSFSKEIGLEKDEIDWLAKGV